VRCSGRKPKATLAIRKQFAKVALLDSMLLDKHIKVMVFTTTKDHGDLSIQTIHRRILELPEVLEWRRLAGEKDHEVFTRTRVSPPH